MAPWLAAAALVGCGGEPSLPAPAPPGPAPPAELRALGYAPWDELADAPEGAPPARDGVVHHGAGASDLVRVWADDESTVHRILPDGTRLPPLRVPGHDQVEFARVLDDGCVLCVSVDQGLTLLGPDGEPRLQVACAAHHEALVVPDGRPPGRRRFAVLTHREVPHRGRSVRFDALVFVDEGSGASDTPHTVFDTHARRPAILEALGIEAHPLDAPGGGDGAYDYFHANGVAFDGPGTVVLCLRNVDGLVTVELTTGRVVGAIGPGVLDWPHAPSFVEDEDGRRRLLVFDNGKHRGWSRVVELDPVTGAPHWEWRGEPGRPLWSEVRGFAQRLPGGSTLVTESERGRALEVDRSGRVLWEFLNPERRGSATGGARRRIYRMTAAPRTAVEAVPMRDAAPARDPDR